MHFSHRYETHSHVGRMYRHHGGDRDVDVGGPLPHKPAGLRRIGGGQPSGWDSKGWTLLGERAVDGRIDHDRIAVGRAGGPFKKATIVVLDSDLDLVDFAVGFGKGAPYHPELKAFFREGTRTRALDLPGDKRVIKYIDFTYRNLPGGGRARVQVWAK